MACTAFSYALKQRKDLRYQTFTIGGHHDPRVDLVDLFPTKAEPIEVHAVKFSMTTSHDLMRSADLFAIFIQFTVFCDACYSSAL